MTTFYIPKAINPKSWTCGEVIQDQLLVNEIGDLERLVQVVAMLADRTDDQTQIEIVRFLSCMEPRP